MKNKVSLSALTLILVVIVVILLRLNKTELISYQIVHDTGPSTVVYVYTDRTVDVYTCFRLYDLMQDKGRDEEKTEAFRLRISEYREVERLVEIIKVSSAEDFFVNAMGTGMGRINIKVDDRIIEVPPSIHFPRGAFGDFVDILTNRYAEEMERLGK